MPLLFITQEQSNELALGRKEGSRKSKLDFTAKNRRRDLVTNVVKVHLELKMEYPDTVNIVQSIRDTKLI